MATPELRGGPAVFSRNWEPYLRSAALIARTHPAQLIPFRSHVPWATAASYVDKIGPIPIYFAENDGDGKVTYSARLRVVHLRPRKSDTVTRKLLRYQLAETKADTGWQSGKGTIYAISHCHRVAKPFSQTALVKLSDETAIDRDYSRSYCLVHTPLKDALLENVNAVDCASLPAKYKDVVVQRVIRDSALVRRLKQIHRDRCQLCGQTVRMLDGSTYSEGHHLQPLGSLHRGPDTSENVLVLCPNCHARCDMAGVYLSAGELRLKPGHSIAAPYLAYHNNLVRTLRTEEA